MEGIHQMMSVTEKGTSRTNVKTVVSTKVKKTDEKHIFTLKYKTEKNFSKYTKYQIIELSLSFQLIYKSL